MPCIRGYPRKPAEIRADPRKDAEYQRGPAEASRVSGGTRGTLQGFRRSPRNLAGYRRRTPRKPAVYQGEAAEPSRDSGRDPRNPAIIRVGLYDYYGRERGRERGRRLYPPRLSDYRFKEPLASTIALERLQF